MSIAWLCRSVSLSRTDLEPIEVSEFEFGLIAWLCRSVSLNRTDREPIAVSEFEVALSNSLNSHRDRMAMPKRVFKSNRSRTYRSTLNSSTPPMGLATIRRGPRVHQEGSQRHLGGVLDYIRRGPSDTQEESQITLGGPMHTTICNIFRSSICCSMCEVEFALINSFNFQPQHRCKGQPQQRCVCCKSPKQFLFHRQKQWTSNTATFHLELILQVPCFHAI